MPIVTHEDEKLLSALEIDVAKLMKEMSSKEKTIASAEAKVADLYADYCRFLGLYVRKLRDLSKQLEILSREQRSGINTDDVTQNKEKVAHVDGMIQKKENYYDKLKDLSMQKKTLLEKRVESAGILIETAKIRKKLVDIGLKIEEAKNKMIPADRIASAEANLKDLEREFERSKKELSKKNEQIEAERQEVNLMWKNLKDAIKDMD